MKKLRLGVVEEVRTSIFQDVMILDRKVSDVKQEVGRGCKRACITCHTCNVSRTWLKMIEVLCWTAVCAFLISHSFSCVFHRTLLEGPSSISSK